MRYDLYVKEVFDVRDADSYRRGNDAKEEELRDGRRGEAGGYHGG